MLLPPDRLERNRSRSRCNWLNAVPITPRFVADLGADQHTASARLVHTIMTQPAMTNGIRLGLYYWWDALAALSAFRNDSIVRFRTTRVRVVLTGPQSGRTAPDPHGVPLQTAHATDRTRFEQTFLGALNGR